MKTHLLACTLLSVAVLNAPAAVINTSYDSIPVEQRLINSDDPVDFIDVDYDSMIYFDHSDYIFNDRDIGYLDILGSTAGPIELYLPSSYNTFGVQMVGQNWAGSTDILVEFFGINGLVGSTTVSTGPNDFYILSSNFQKTAVQTSESFNLILLHTPGNNTGQIRIANDSLILANTAPIPEPHAALLLGLGAVGVNRRKRK